MYCDRCYKKGHTASRCLAAAPAFARQRSASGTRKGSGKGVRPAINVPCKNYFLGGSCRYGLNCMFSHIREPTEEEMHKWEEEETVSPTSSRLSKGSGKGSSSRSGSVPVPGSALPSSNSSSTRSDTKELVLNSQLDEKTLLAYEQAAREARERRKAREDAKAEAETSG